VSASEDTLRLRWFGGFTGGKAFVTVLLLGFAYVGHSFFGSDFLGAAALLLLSMAYLDGWTELDLQRAEVRRTVYFLWLLPVWRSTVSLRQGGRLCVTFRPSFRDARHWHDRDFTVIDLRYGPRDWIELAQTDRSGGNFSPAMLDKARRLSARLHMPLEARVERVSGALEYKDNSAASPPPELRH